MIPSTGADGRAGGGGRFGLLALLLAFLVLARGMMVLCVMPPLEAWDEYQHVAYIEHMQSRGDWPILLNTKVPEPLMNRIRLLPMARMAIETQLGPGGGITHEQYWRGERPEAPYPPPPPLYQAQHSPFYYALMGPLWRMTAQAEDLRGAVAVLRIANILLMAAAVWLFAQAIRLLVQDDLLAYGAAVLTALHPLFLLAGARVANDSLAIALAGGCLLALAGYLRAGADGKRERCGLLASLAGLLLAGGIWAKSTNLGLIPVAGAALLWPALRREMSGRWTAVMAGCFGTVLALCLAPLVMHNLQQYGMLVVTGEGLANRNAGRSTAEILAAVLRIDWVGSLYGWWWANGLWVGGWSFLRLPAAVRVPWYTVSFTVVGILGLCPLMRPMRMRLVATVREQPAGLGLAAVTVLCTTLALAAHALQSFVYAGEVGTNSWYAAAGIPLFQVLIVATCKLALPGRGVRWAVLAIAGLYIVAELVGTLVMMARHYGPSEHALANLWRLAELQPPWMGGVTLAASGLSATGLAVWVLQQFWTRTREYEQ